MKKYTMQDMIESILKLVDLNQINHNNNDVFRTNHCAASANAEARVFRFLGVEYDFGTWMDGSFEMVGYFMVDGVTLVKNGEVNWKAYADAVVDEEHHWCDRALAITQR